MPDITKTELPRKEWHELAEDLLSRFPGVDRAELLKKMVAHYFFEMSYGTKAGERAACEFLNELQVKAHKLQHAPAETANSVICERVAKTENVNALDKTT
jgi:hypothetical protein